MTFLEWFKQKLAGPLIMFLITSLSAGVWSLVAVSLNNKDDLLLISEQMKNAVQKNQNLDTTDEKLAQNIQLLTDNQLKLRLDVADTKAEVKMLRKDIEAEIKLIRRDMNRG